MGAVTFNPFKNVDPEVMDQREDAGACVLCGRDNRDGVDARCVECSAAQCGECSEVFDPILMIDGPAVDYRDSRNGSDLLCDSCYTNLFDWGCVA